MTTATRAKVRRFDPSLIRRREPSELEILTARLESGTRAMAAQLRAIFPPLSRAERAAMRPTVTVRRSP